jgi:hypothetical protein
MAQTFTASVRGWSQKALNNAELVLRGSVQDTGELMTRRAQGVSDGGALIPGRVPVVSGELVNSQQVGINGSVIGRGDVSYAAVVSGLELGDVIEAGFTAPYARKVEYYGWFFVRNAVQQWPVIVEQNAAQFRDS